MASFSYTGLTMGGNTEESLRSVQDYMDPENSDSDNSVASAAHARPNRQKLQAWACLSLAGIGIVLMICRFGVLGWASMEGGSPANSGDQDVDFGEKVMIMSQPSEAPATLAGGPGEFPPLGSEATDLNPTENLNDGNVCADTEELLDGLCYRKCSLLTGGQDTIRTSPWTCCEKHPCTVNQKLDISARLACTGFAVGGDGSCPHTPGTCLKDEELYLGICYKKCSLLTEDAYPFRVAAATCCQDSSIMSCLDFRKDYTSGEFAVGGERANAGACLDDEELLLGQCYKKCSLLTEGEYPLRLTAATCCKANARLPHQVDGVWHLGCLDPRKDKTSAAFNTLGDQRQSGANTGAHYPLKNLTEVQGSVSI